MDIMVIIMVTTSSESNPTTLLVFSNGFFIFLPVSAGGCTSSVVEIAALVSPSTSTVTLLTGAFCFQLLTLVLSGIAEIPLATLDTHIVSETVEAASPSSFIPFVAVLMVLFL